jgi:GntR family transcriptional regulator/MocR family aminotransferase
MHVVLDLPDRTLASRLVAEAGRRGVALWTLDRYFAGPPARAGLVIGYGTATEPQVRRACGLLRELLNGA